MFLHLPFPDSFRLQKTCPITTICMSGGQGAKREKPRPARRHRAGLFIAYLGLNSRCRFFRSSGHDSWCCPGNCSGSCSSNCSENGSSDPCCLSCLNFPCHFCNYSLTSQIPPENKLFGYSLSMAEILPAYSKKFAAVQTRYAFYKYFPVTAKVLQNLFRIFHIFLLTFKNNMVILYHKLFK